MRAHDVGHFLGPVHEIPFLARQHRIVFAQIGQSDPLDLAEYEAHDGFVALRKALGVGSGGSADGIPEEQSRIIEEISQSGLRGRGGAAFPAGIKWTTVLETDADQKYVVANADEGDPANLGDG